MTCWTNLDKRHRLLLNLCTIVCASTFVASLRMDVDSTINIPQDKTDCICSWSKWMNSGTPDDTGVEDETSATLRKRGYKFCSTPVDIQCFNVHYASLQLRFATVCEVNLGLKCTLLCDDYAVRFACCYCPPESQGPEFQIESQSPGGGCLVAIAPVTEDAPHAVAVAETCDASQKSQKWSWVSNYVIKNSKTQQCIAVEGSTYILEDCDVGKGSQQWIYRRKRHLLQKHGTGTYLRAKRDNTLTLSTNRGFDSQWLSKVEMGRTGMENMKNPKCEPALDAPGNGSIDCTLGSYFSSQCTFSCKYGYRLPEDMENPSVCAVGDGRVGEFTLSTPTCEQIFCHPAVEALDHGSVFCSNGNNIDSSCMHACDTEYVLTGSKELICMEDGNWNNRRPTCEQARCSPDLRNEGMQNGIVRCTSGSFPNSKCTYTCDEGHKLIGPSLRTCRLTGLWDESSPICLKIQCPLIPPIYNGRMTCSHGLDYLSVCIFTCNVGYTRLGSVSATCNVDEEGGSFGWNFRPPTCTRIACRRQVSPMNGAVSCTKNELLGSLCTFTCARGFKMTGTSTPVTCREDGWDKPSPSCEQISCPPLPDFSNGKLYCSNGNNFGSTCFAICGEGYDILSGSQIGPVRCQLDGSWSGDVATCKRIQCRVINHLPQGIMTCSDSNNYNSTCTFECNAGFYLVGAKKATCTKYGWDAQIPNCGGSDILHAWLGLSCLLGIDVSKLNLTTRWEERVRALEKLTHADI